MEKNEKIIFIDDADLIKEWEEDPQSTEDHLIIQEKRHAHTDRSFHAKYPSKNQQRKGIIGREYDKLHELGNCTRTQLSAAITSKVPLIKTIRGYDWKDDLLADAVAGFTVCIMQIPQGMSYALLAGIPPINGIYMSFFPVLIYGLLGTSPHISMGTYAVQCMMLGTAVHKHHDIDPVEVAQLCALWAGIYLVCMGFLQLHSVMVLLSDMMVSGFTCGAAFHVLTSQIPVILGIEISPRSGAFAAIRKYVEIFSKITDCNVMTIIVSVITMTTLALNNELLKPYVAKRSRVPVPMELLLVIAGTLSSYFFQFKPNYNMIVVGKIPTGFPDPSLPNVEYLGDVAVDAFIITLIGFATTYSLAKLFAAKKGTIVDPQQELYAIGWSNVFGSLFGCGPTSSSLSRASVQVNAGARTTLTPLISCVFLVFVLLWVGPLLQDLPKCVLASIIIVSLKGMFMHVHDLMKALKTSKTEATMWLVPCVVTIIFNIDYGLYCGVAVAVMILLYRTQTPPVTLLGKLPGTNMYVDMANYPMAKEIYGVKIFKMCGGLYFSTREYFQEKLFQLIGVNPRKYLLEKKILEKQGKRDNGGFLNLQHLVLDLSAMSSIDVDGAHILTALHEEFNTINVRLYIVTGTGHIRAKVHRLKVVEKMEYGRCFPSVPDAVAHIENAAQNAPTDSDI